MHLTRYVNAAGAPQWGIADGTTVRPLAGDGAAQVAAALASSASLPGRGEPVALDGVRVLPPLLPDATVYCIGLNYKSHADETGNAPPAEPSLFIRTAASLVGHGEPLQRPSCSVMYDFEGEIAIVVGKPGHDIARDDAAAHVGGYTCFNDGSIRDWQKHSVSAGKNFHASGAAGPWIVTASDIVDAARIPLTTRLNGEQVQHADLSQLIYPVATIVSYISRFARLRTGDVIATGTPAGIGARRKPQLWMQPGDTIEVEVGGVGVLRNPVVAAH